MKTLHPTKRNLLKVQAHQVNVCVAQQAPLPSSFLENCRKLVEEVRGIIHYLFYVLAIKTPTMVRIELYSYLFQQREYFCFDARLLSYLPFPHFIQF